MPRAWQYLRIDDLKRPSPQPPSERYAKLAAAVWATKGRGSGGLQGYEDAQSELLDALGRDGWELVVLGNYMGSDSGGSLIFKRELPIIT